MTSDELKFKAEDFPFLRAILHRAEIDGLVEHANGILREKLERAPEVVTTSEVPTTWFFTADVRRGLALLHEETHKARLVCIEEVGK